MAGCAGSGKEIQNWDLTDPSALIRSTEALASRRLIFNVLKNCRRRGVIIQSDCVGILVNDYFRGKRRFTFPQPLGPSCTSISVNR